MRELSYAGFGVFTMKLYNLYTKIEFRSYQNTNRPNDKGTYILHDREIDSKNVISGISCDKGFTVINIKNI